jgi:serine/threonine protein kinase
VVEEPTASDTPAGLRFGHYRLRRLLGQGGFGEVYEAEDTVMDRVVALKLLATPYSRPDGALAPALIANEVAAANSEVGIRSARGGDPARCHGFGLAL